MSIKKTDTDDDEYADFAALYNAPCAGLTGSECSANQTCLWDNKNRKCIRDPEKFHQNDNVALKNMTDTLSERSDSFRTHHRSPSHRPESHSQESHHFIVKELSPNDPLFESLGETHFLKRRKREILADDVRMIRRNGSMDYYKMTRLDPNKKYTPQYIQAYNEDEAKGDKLAKYVEAKYVKRIKEMPIVFYASEIPVQVILPEQYTGAIGSVSFMSKTQIPHMLYLPELKTGNELSFDVGKKNTIEFLSPEALAALQARRALQARKDAHRDQTLGTTYTASPGWSQPTKSADYVTYTADGKKSHPTLRTGQYWEELGNGLYTILTYAGGSSSGRRSRKRTRNVRKHKIRSRKHKHHKRTQRNRSRPQSRVRK